MVWNGPCMSQSSSHLTCTMANTKSKSSGKPWASSNRFLQPVIAPHSWQLMHVPQSSNPSHCIPWPHSPPTEQPDVPSLGHPLSPPLLALHGQLGPISTTHLCLGPPIQSLPPPLRNVALVVGRAWRWVAPSASLCPFVSAPALPLLVVDFILQKYPAPPSFNIDVSCIETSSFGVSTTPSIAMLCMLNGLLTTLSSLAAVVAWLVKKLRWPPETFMHAFFSIVSI